MKISQMTHQITQSTRLPKAVLLSVFLVSVFFLGGSQKAQAEQAVVFYSNPQGGTCTDVDPSYVLTSAEASAGYTLNEGCVSYNQENGTCLSGYVYQKCSPGFNDVSNENGAVASFAAAMNKTTYSPGETGWVSMIGSLGSYPGSEFANAVVFFTPDIGGLHNVVCWFLSCPVTRRVDMSATIQQQDNYGGCNHNNEPPYGDPNGYGFKRWISNCVNNESGQSGSWMTYRSTFLQGAKGSISGGMNFRAPINPGNYAVDFVGCHEKFGWSCGRATLNFTVTAPPAPPTINVRF